MKIIASRDMLSGTPISDRADFYEFDGETVAIAYPMLLGVGGSTVGLAWHSCRRGDAMTVATDGGPIIDAALLPFVMRDGSPAPRDILATPEPKVETWRDRAIRDPIFR